MAKKIKLELDELDAWVINLGLSELGLKQGITEQVHGLYLTEYAHHLMRTLHLPLVRPGSKSKKVRK